VRRSSRIGALTRWIGRILVASTLVATPANAESVVFVGADGDVRISSPDGSRQSRVTVDGTQSLPYLSPSQTDAGEIAAIKKADADSNRALVHFFNADGSSAGPPWRLATTPGAPNSFVPVTGGQIAPSGGLLAYDDFFGPVIGEGEYRISFVAGARIDNPCTFSCERDGFRPRWIPQIDGVGFIGNDVGAPSCCDVIYVQTQSGPKSWIGFENTFEGDVDSFDVSRQGRTLVEFSADGESAGEPGSLELVRNRSPPPAKDFVIRCVTESFAPVGAYPRWSPSGRWIAWEGTAGIFTSPAPVPRGAGGRFTPCRLTPKLIGRGGSRPDWGKQDAPPTGPRCNGKKPTLVGNGRANVLRGTSKADVIVGLGGNDTLNGLKGNDSLCGGAGKDRIKGGTGRDVLLGGTGRDVLLGGGGRDRLVGGPGRDRERQ
jgi:hypothetical protein